jgi:hypothetical protein
MARGRFAASLDKIEWIGTEEVDLSGTILTTGGTALLLYLFVLWGTPDT